MRYATRIAGGLAVALLIATLAGPAAGQGILVPKDKDIPPLAVKYLRVDTSIEDQAATTRVSQAFVNATARDLECTYIFPLPEGAAIRDFAMTIGGKRQKGELVEAGKARRVYESIVRRMKDPALLEYMGCDLLKLRIFPVPAGGEQKVELEYSEVIPVDGGIGEYVFPLSTGGRASRTVEDFTVAVRITSSTPIKSVYSPTHEVGVSRPSEHRAVAGMEAARALLDRDFQILFTLSDAAFGLHLMTFRPDPKAPGTFLALVSPKSEINADERVPRDLAFVIDTSGSMRHESKMEQAKKALASCIENLASEDRFAIVRFATMAEVYPSEKGWARAEKGAKGAAQEWIRGLEPAGGTNIDEALQKVLALPVETGRPTTVLLLTDGQPTVQTTDIQQLVQKVLDAGAKDRRIFTLGVGDDVNTHLLDRIASETGGLPTYVRPGQAVDRRIERLFAKMSHPVMTGLELAMPGVKVLETYPRELPDLYRGTQLVVVGRYEGSGHSAVALTGRTGEEAESFTYEALLPEQDAGRPFIESIFAKRKIGYLLDQIRLHGENKELLDEVTRLSLEHGIQTPYTSYLVLESEEQYKQYNIARGGGRTGFAYDRTADRRDPDPARAPRASAERREAAKRAEAAARRLGDEFRGAREAEPPSAADTPAPAAESERGQSGERAGGPQTGNAGAENPSAGGYTEGITVKPGELRDAETGTDAVDIATKLARMKTSDTDARARGRTVRRAGDRRMVRWRGVWVDEAFAGDETITRVKWGSAAYFKLLEVRPDLKSALALGRWVVLKTAEGKAVLISADDGVETMDAGTIERLFAAE